VDDVAQSSRIPCHSDGDNVFISGSVEISADQEQMDGELIQLFPLRDRGRKQKSSTATLGLGLTTQWVLDDLLFVIR
jgi:hypothetical protein